jgi:carotenoid cleavage dioxygenase-like enzyme
MGYQIPEDIRMMGPLTPMRFEATVDECIVQGEIPEQLCGGFYRVGPAWKRPTKQGCNGFSTQDGMVQALLFRDGRVDFRNRWIRTPKYLLEEHHGRGMFEWADGRFSDWRGYGLGEVVRDEHTTGVPQGTALVNVFPFGGQVLASGEQGLPPIALDPWTLDTVGIVPWSSKLGRGMVEPACFGDGTFTAHPKWDEDTGELFGLSYRDHEPFVTMHIVSADGAVRSKPLWDVPYACNAHDVWLTPDHIVVPIQPFTVGLERIDKDLSVFGWDPELPIVLVLVPRDLGDDVRYITADIEPQYIMHTMSANVDGDRLVLDGPIFDRPPFPFEDQVDFGVDFVPFGSGVAGRWIIDLATGSVTSERVGDKPVEFPKVDERFYGKGYRYGFLTEGDSLWTLDTVVRRDVRSGREDRFTITRDQMIALFELTFVPRGPEAPEGDGYVIVPVSRFLENRSEFVILDTQNISSGPIASIHLPFQIGWTPHGHWMDHTGVAETPGAQRRNMSEG